jgi:hypothetical protein
MNPYNLNLSALKMDSLGNNVNCTRDEEIYLQRQAEANSDALYAILLALGGVAASELNYRQLNQKNVGIKYVDAACKVLGWNCQNQNAFPVYIKFYDQLVAPIATDIPKKTISVAAGPGGESYVHDGSGLINIVNKLWIRITTGFTDTDDTAPGEGLINMDVDYILS